ncbi:tRNA lysidine(34) synthetase TilS [Catenovulum sp. SM1970]|uniref:tRNA lysidine(34) synthetase TilS n=1 Tax=Marinifaba aquimaris TaxID=2741323 RepID=UPI00157303F2|nr:tRNA lysidine(34) synthetase TilS [Marinifaba aquimaris]NTS77076.1 tRNA lysidine(34) synthetase TilS [Marinifaba aquimaris]
MKQHHFNQSLTQLLDKHSLASNAKQQWYVALSGGLDSICLFHLLAHYCQNRADISLKALHVHHGLSPNADKWAQHCQNVAQSLSLDCEVLKAEIKPQAQLSLEAQARDARYQLIEKAISGKALVFTGQHLDDQVETFLLRLNRGSGPKGLSAMSSVRPLNQSIYLVRPLLTFKRKQLVAYAEQQQLSWVDDESNLDNRFDRNYYRNEVIPELEQRFSGFADCVARSAQLCGEYADLVEEVAKTDLASVLDEQRLNIASLLLLSDLRQKNLIRLWLNDHQIDMPSLAQLEELLKQIRDSESDSGLNFKLGEFSIRHYQGHLYLQKLAPDNKYCDIKWIGQATIKLEDDRILQMVRGQQGNLKAPDNNQQVSIRFEIPGSTKAKPYGRAGSRSVKKLLHEYSVPPWLRSRVPFIFYDEKLVAAVGLWVEQTHHCNLGEDSIELKLTPN